MLMLVTIINLPQLARNADLGLREFPVVPLVLLDSELYQPPTRGAPRGVLARENNEEQGPICGHTEDEEDVL